MMNQGFAYLTRLISHFSKFTRLNSLGYNSRPSFVYYVTLRCIIISTIVVLIEFIFFKFRPEF